FNRIPFFDANFLKPSLYANITVHALSILYTDNSYFQRALRVAATKNNQSVEEWKQHIINLLDSATKKTQDRLTINALGAFGEFIKKPSPISLKIEPDTPKSLGEIFYHIRDIHYLSTVLHTQIATKQ
ncbi:hypothetical protein KAH37_10650, partial [bacterium]|nr:hypothetical protein [bacterium]